MGQPWNPEELLPASIKVSEELAKRDDEGFKISVSKSIDCNWDDAIYNWVHSLFEKEDD